MRQQFDIAGGTFPGYHHIGTSGQMLGDRNQDAWGWAAGENYLVVSVHDGCSGKDEERLRSELGSLAASRMFPQILAELLEAGIFSWKKALSLYVERLQLITQALVGSDIKSRAQIVSRYLMFTTVAAVVTPETTTIASLGDGYFVVNGGALQRIGPFAKNKPPYVGYLLYDSQHPKDQLVFEVRAALPTSELESLLIGSDGIGEFASHENTNLPGKSRTVGALSQLWTDDSLYRTGGDPDEQAFLPRLRPVNSAVSKLRRSGGTITDLDYFPPLIEDDYTAVVVRRKKS